jgi:imidazoleglycerol-phosphate dehydratase
MRTANITRQTAETQISVTLNLDGTGVYDNQTGIGFFDHMLDQLSRHALIDMTIRTTGDLHIDDHHTVEDTGIAIGQALVQALGDKRGIRRYADCHLAMDDAQVRCALDLSGRPYLICNLDLPFGKIGPSFDTELVREFFQALSTHGASRCRSTGCTALTRTTSPRRRSNPSPAPFAWRSRLIRARLTPFHRPRVACDHHRSDRL